MEFKMPKSEKTPNTDASKPTALIERRRPSAPAQSRKRKKIPPAKPYVIRKGWL